MEYKTITGLLQAEDTLKHRAIFLHTSRYGCHEAKELRVCAAGRPHPAANQSSQLVADCQTLAPLGSTPAKHVATGAGLHSFPKTMLVPALSIGRLIRPFHKTLMILIELTY
jgi:hypothetical protein